MDRGHARALLNSEVNVLTTARSIFSGLFEHMQAEDILLALIAYHQELDLTNNPPQYANEVAALKQAARELRIERLLKEGADL